MKNFKHKGREIFVDTYGIDGKFTSLTFHGQSVSWACQGDWGLRSVTIPTNGATEDIARKAINEGMDVKYYKF